MVASVPVWGEQESIGRFCLTGIVGGVEPCPIFRGGNGGVGAGNLLDHQIG